jgi:hypothetical protein
MTAVAVVAALCALVISLLALLIAIGTARRTRAGAVPAAHGGSGEMLPTVGVGVPRFDSVDVAGVTIDSDRLASGRHALAFVSSACDACRDSLPEFLSLAGTVGAGRTLAVLLDDDEDPGIAVGMAQQLQERSTVVVEDVRRDLSKQFDVQSYPTFVGVQDGVVLLSSHRVADLARWHRA